LVTVEYATTSGQSVPTISPWISITGKPFFAKFSASNYFCANDIGLFERVNHRKIDSWLIGVMRKFCSLVSASVDADLDLCPGTTLNRMMAFGLVKREDSMSGSRIMTEMLADLQNRHRRPEKYAIRERLFFCLSRTSAMSRMILE
jgi:hypothetical protein